MSLPKPLKTGDGLTLDYLRRTDAEIAGGRLKVDPRSGLQLLVTPFGAFLRSLFPPSGWYKVTGAVSGMSGAYTLVEQFDAVSGSWADGPGVVSLAWEANSNASVPTGKRVWARKRFGAWRFSYGACS